MNSKLERFARDSLKEDLNLLPERWQEMFKLIYGSKNGKRSIDNIKLMSINDVVDEIPSEKLDWAMQQVENSINKINKLNSIT